MLEVQSQLDALVAAVMYLPGKSIPLPLRVLHIHTASAWEYGLAGYLNNVADLKVRDVPAKNESILLTELTCFQPNVILLNAAAPLNMTHLRVWPSEQLAQSLVRFIVIDPDNNIMDIYDADGKRHVVVTRLADLSQCIQGQYQM